MQSRKSGVEVLPRVCVCVCVCVCLAAVESSVSSCVCETLEAASVELRKASWPSHPETHLRDDCAFVIQHLMLMMSCRVSAHTPDLRCVL